MLLTHVKRSALLALAAVGVAAPSAQAATAASPVVKLRDQQDRLVCSGALVAPRYVLTSGRCAKRAVITVQERSATVPPYKVATILRAPKSGGRRPDLALVQLTAPSATTPVTLFSGQKKARKRKKLRAAGWSSSTKLRSVAGRRAAPKRCGKKGRAGTLCARVKRVPARSCKDAAGASLLARQAGQLRLVGIGSRTRTGCKKHPRARFADVTSSAVQTWIAAAVQEATGQPAPSGSPTPTPTPTPGAPVPAADTYVGTWKGQISEDKNNNATGLIYPATLDIRSGGAPGDVVGTSSYSAPNGSVDCTGTLTIKTTLSDGTVVYTERLDSGQGNCIDGGEISLAHVSGDPSTITYTWQKPGAPDRSSGRLVKS